MEPTRTAEGIRIGGDARQRLHAARGYGEPVEEGVRLHPLEAAYLLYRGDIPPVDGADFAAFLADEAGDGFLTKLFVYKDLRERGYYLSVVGDRSTAFDLEVFERGATPPDGPIGFRVSVVDERDEIDPAALTPGVLGLVDGEGEVGYVDVEQYTPHGRSARPDRSNLDASLMGERALVWDPPASLYTRDFFGQPIGGRDTHEGTLQLSLEEALYLAEEGVISIPPEAVRAAAYRREREEHFDARAAVLRALREAGAVAKTGFKFGADLRVYHTFSGVDDMDHSDVLVRVLPVATTLSPPALALDVRLAHGVGKRMVFALTRATDERIDSWLSVTRKTP